MGKSWLACHHAKKSGRTVLLTDPNVDCLWPKPATFDLFDAIQRALSILPVDGGRFDCSLRQSIRWVPRSAQEFDAMAAAVLSAQAEAEKRDIPELEWNTDEIAAYTTAHYAPENFERVVRWHRHLRCEVRMTTQDPKDVPRKLRNCIRHVYCFRLEEEESLRVMKRWFDVEKVKKLREREYLEYHVN